VVLWEREQLPQKLLQLLVESDDGWLGDHRYERDLSNSLHESSQNGPNRFGAEESFVLICVYSTFHYTLLHASRSGKVKKHLKMLEACSTYQKVAL
jgi:hypothetical protein